jgi:hypothetical protein
MSELRHAALRYALRGWHVFPVLPRRKTPPLTRRGFHDASRDPGLVNAWWQERPDANVGIATGASGLVVVDVDGEEGAVAWEELCERHGGLPETLVARTAKGWHYYLKGSGRSSTGRLAPGIDTRGVGGYTLAPPSLVAWTGGSHIYRWRDPEAELLPAPGWVAEAPKPPPPAAVGEERELPDGAPFTSYGRNAQAALVDEMTSTGEGRRNATLNALAYRAGRLVAAGQLAAHVARTELVAAALASGLDGEEVGRTFQSGFAAGLQIPARVGARP